MGQSQAYYAEQKVKFKRLPALIFYLYDILRKSKQDREKTDRKLSRPGERITRGCGGTDELILFKLMKAHFAKVSLHVLHNFFFVGAIPSRAGMELRVLYK